MGSPKREAGDDDAEYALAVCAAAASGPWAPTKRMTRPDFVEQVRQVDMTPHVAQNDTRRGGSAIDARTTRHPGYWMSQHTRPVLSVRSGGSRRLPGCGR